MNDVERPMTILVAEDDEDDRLLITRAFVMSRLSVGVRFVGDGEELLEYLRRPDDEGARPRPDLILLDLNMPRMGGFEALAELKGDPELRSIPTVVLTTSDWSADVARSYATGANGYVIKPPSLDRFALLMEGLHRYWREVVELPLPEQPPPGAKEDAQDG